MAKIGSCALLASALCLLIKRSNPELALPLAALVCAGGTALLLGVMKPVMELLQSAVRISGVSPTVFYPVLKALIIGICARTVSELCRDAGQAAMAGTVELAGSICALYAALPLARTLLDMLEELA